MKILHVITTIELGGAEKQLVTLVKNQILLGHTVRLLYLKGKRDLESSFQLAGAEVDSAIANKSFLKQMLYLRNLAKDHKFTATHAHLPRSELVCFLSLRKFNSLVISRHNAEKFWPRVPTQLSSFISKLICGRAKYVICISKAVKDFVVSTGEIREVDIPKLRVIYYSIDSDLEIKAPRSSQSNRTGIDFVCISRLVNQKDIPTLLKAFAIHVKVSPRSTLKIIGIGPLKQTLANLSNELGTNSQVTWVGKSRDVETLLNSSDALVLTSRYEGFGLVLIEAAAAGLPILCTSSTAALEVLGDGHPGLFPIEDYEALADKMFELLDQNRYYENSKKNPVILQRFRPEQTAHVLTNLYMDI